MQWVSNNNKWLIHATLCESKNLVYWVKKARSPCIKRVHTLCSIDLHLHLLSVYVLCSPVAEAPMDSDIVKVNFQFLNCYTLLVPLRNFADIFSFTVYFPNSQAHIPNSGPEKTLLGTSSMRLTRQHTRYISHTAGRMN